MEAAAEEESAAADVLEPEVPPDVPPELRARVTKVSCATRASLPSDLSHGPSCLPTQMMRERLQSAAGQLEKGEKLPDLAGQLEAAVYDGAIKMGGSAARTYKATSRSVASVHNLCSAFSANGHPGRPGCESRESVVAALLSGRASARGVVAAHLGACASPGLGHAAVPAAAASGGGDADALVPKLWAATVAGDCEAVGKMLDTSPAGLINQPYHHQGGKIALHGAALHGHVKLMMLLIERGAVVNARDRFSGSTPLHMASQAGRADAITCLLECGADASMTNSQGRTPRDLVCAALSSLVTKHLNYSNLFKQESRGSAHLRLQVANEAKGKGEGAQRYARCERSFDDFVEKVAATLLRRVQLLRWATVCSSAGAITTTAAAAAAQGPGAAAVGGAAAAGAGAATWALGVSGDLVESIALALNRLELPSRAVTQRAVAERARVSAAAAAAAGRGGADAKRRKTAT